MNFVKKVKRKLIKIWDNMNGYDFMTAELPEVNGLDRSYANKAAPSGDGYLRRVLKTLPITANDSILDIGCARGAAMKLFCKFPFKAIAGIELAEKVAAICEANFKKFGDDRVSTYHADATKFEKYAEFNYFYLYNPFPTRELLEIVVNKICADCSGTVYIIYNTPMNIDLFYDKGFKIVGEYEADWGNKMIVLTADL